MTTPTTSHASAAGFDLTETDRLLTTTRAVRKRLDLERPVEREVVLDCLRVATQAPSGGNTQPWRWLVVDDPEIRAGLADIYRKGYGPYIEMQKAAVVAAGGDEDSAILRSSDYLAEHLHEVPVHVIPCLLEPPARAADDGRHRGVLRVDPPGGVELHARAAAAGASARRTRRCTCSTRRRRPSCSASPTP